jgi:HAD superfamily hydrolase (TIGR01549 family)
MTNKVAPTRNFSLGADPRVPAMVLDPASIRAVLFDLDGTLYRQGLMRVLMALELLTLPLNSPARASRRLKALRAYRHAQEALRHSPSATPSRDQLTAAASASGLPVNEVDELVTEWMIQRPLKYLQFCRAAGVPQLLARLASAGIRTGVLSDYPATDKLRALGLDQHFSPVLCSTDPDIAAFKPHPRGYLRACEIWNLTPGDVLFVGDRSDVDAAGAAAAGMPCAIVGQAEAPAPGAGYTVFSSFERLSRVFDRR